MPTDTRWHVTIPILTCGWDATNQNPHFPALIPLGGRGARVAIADTTEADFCPPSQSSLQQGGPARPRIAGAPPPHSHHGRGTEEPHRLAIESGLETVPATPSFPSQPKNIAVAIDGDAREEGPGVRLEPTAKSVHGMISSSRQSPHYPSHPLETPPPGDEGEIPSSDVLHPQPRVSSHPFVVGQLLLT